MPRRSSHNADGASSTGMRAADGHMVPLPVGRGAVARRSRVAIASQRVVVYPDTS